MATTYPKDGQPLLDSVIQAHGGLERWKRVSQIKVKFFYYGRLLEVKGYPGVWNVDVSIETKGEPKIKMVGLGHGPSGESWHTLGNKRMWIEDASGNVVRERPRPREAYGTNPDKLAPWSDLDLGYFIGYALYNYLTVPFIFAEPGFSVRELTPYQEPGNTKLWRVLEVTHPDDFPTHTKIQRFYFGSEDFLLRRVNYETDVLGGVAAHYVYDYKRVGGLGFPTLRRVVPRDPNNDVAMQDTPTAFGLHYTEIEIDYSDGTSSSGLTA